MKYSIIVPVFNAQQHIKQCMDSILNQKFKNLEIILVDDGSTDESSKICDSYKNNDERVIVIHKDNGGPNSARKSGAEIASGDYIINIDSDDFLDIGYFEKIDELVNRYLPDMIIFGFKKRVCNREDYSYPVLPEGLYKDERLNYLRENYLYNKSLPRFNCGIIGYNLWSKIVKKDIYKSSQLKVSDSITVGEDTIVSSYLLEKSESIYISHCAYYNYIVHSSSIMNKCDIRNIRQFNMTVEALKKIAYIQKDQIYLYSYMNLYTELCKIARSVDSYKSFCDIVKSTFSYNTIWEMADSVNRCDISGKQRVIHFLLSKRCFRMIYYLHRAASK